MPITIKDIAKAAGVSHTTVSRALNNRSAISIETTERIQKLAKEMGYIPSAVAQSLHSRQTRTIGMVITTIADPFISRVVDGVESVAQEAGYSIFLASSHNDSEKELAVVDTFHRRRVDAIIVTSSRVGRLYSSQLDKIQIPIVLINNSEEGEYLYSVSADHVQGAQLAVEHLIKLGHRRIGYIGSAGRPGSSQQRLVGYRTALEKAGILIDKSLVFSSDSPLDIELNESIIQAISNSDATAIFCFNDMIAIGLMMACKNQNIIVPRQLSIIGFDDTEVSSFVSPTLTTIHQPRLRLGKLAMNMALDLLKGQPVTDKKLPCELLVRQSTGAPLI